MDVCDMSERRAERDKHRRKIKALFPDFISFSLTFPHLLFRTFFFYSSFPSPFLSFLSVFGDCDVCSSCCSTSILTAVCVYLCKRVFMNVCVCARHV